MPTNGEEPIGFFPDPEEQAVHAQSNEYLCEHVSKIIVYKKCKFLDILKELRSIPTRDLPRKTKRLRKGECYNNCIRKPKFSPTALYFNPEVLNGSKLRFDVNMIYEDKRCMFSLNTPLEISSTPVQLVQSAKSVPSIVSNPSYATMAQIDNSGFFATELQFHYLADLPFHEKVGLIEVGLWEILELLRYSDYIGISGARVSTGNHEILEIDQHIISACNQDYFTLKFSGFLKGKKNRKKGLLTLIPNQFAKGIYDPSVPGTVWGAPCPPTWIPQ